MGGWSLEVCVHLLGDPVQNYKKHPLSQVQKINGDPVFWGSSNIYWYFLLLLTWPTPFWGRKTQQVHRFFGNMSMDLQARHLTCAPILRVPQVTSIDCIHLWFIRNIILYLRKPNIEQKCQASHPPPRYMLLVRNS